MSTATAEPNDWTWDGAPAAPGWYAALYGWEDDGTWDSAFQWDGGRWVDAGWNWPGGGPPVVGFAGPFPDKEVALDWANANHPETPRQAVAAPPSEG